MQGRGTTSFQKRHLYSKSAYRFFALFIRDGFTRRAHSSFRSSSVRPSGAFLPTTKLLRLLPPGTGDSEPRAATEPRPLPPPWRPPSIAKTSSDA